MARTPKPWWRSSHGCFYAKIGGKQVRLDPDQARAIEVLRELLAPSPAPSGITVADLVERYLSDARGRVAPTTFATYDYSLHAFAAFAGGRDAASIRGHDLNAWSSSRRWGKASRRTYCGHVRDMLRWAHDQGLTATYALGRLKLPQGDRRQPITEDQAQKFRAAITEPAIALWWDLATACGARPGELRTLEAPSVAPDRRSAAVRGKTGERVVWFPETTRAILEGLCAIRPTGPLLLNCVSGAWTRVGLGGAFRRVSVRTGLRVVPYHTRSLFAMRRIRAGVDALTLAKLMGHSNPAMTLKWYASWADSTLAQAVDRTG